MTNAWVLAAAGTFSGLCVGMAIMGTLKEHRDAPIWAIAAALFLQVIK